MCGSLPYSLTVTFTGLKNKTHSVHCPLTFESDFGCGAAGVAMEPGGCLDDEPECGASNVGPLTSVLLTEPGHGYARIGRKEPVLSVSGGSGTGATFTPTLAAVDGTLDKQCRTYKIASIAVSGGNGYADNDPLTITTDGTTVTPAVAVVRTSTTRVQPTVTASVGGVTGESLSVTLASNGGSPETWGVSAVGVVTAGTGWSSNDWTLPVTFATSDTTVTAATATATRQVISPGAEYSYTSGGGTGFSATVTLTEQTCDDGHPCWLPASISITSGGTGYAVDDVIEFLAINRDIANGIEGVANYTVLSVDGSGGVLSVSGPDVPEPFRKFTGGIDSIKVDSAGAYYKLVDGGTPSSVDVTAPGEYYTEDPTAPACVADVTVKVDCAEGSGYPSPTAEATINATIDDDPTSATFGQITALDIASGGSGYLVWMWVCTNLSSLNNVPIVLKAEWTDRIWTLVDGIPTTYTDVLHPAKQLVSLEVGSCFGSGACIKIIPTGDDITCETEPTTRPGEYSGQPGPIQKIELIEGGSGYVVKGRVAPEWTVTANGYEFTPTFGKSKTDDCGLEWWPVESLAFDPAEDKTELDGWAINFTPTPPERSDEPFLAIVRTRQEPTVTATAKAPGTGAEVSVTLAESDVGAAVAVAKLSGFVSSIAVLDGGGGYSAAPTVIIDGNATGKATIAGPVVSLTLTDGGSGYTSSPSVSFSGGGGGSGAAATAVVGTQGAISGLVLTKSGSNYTSAPAVVFTGGGGSGAKATAKIIGKVSEVSVTSGGSGYSQPPTVSLKGGGGFGVSVAAKISAKVSEITIVDSGSGYTEAPVVSILGGGGSGATATATVKDGSATGITLTDGGSGYYSEPVIEISGGRPPIDLHWRVASLSVKNGGSGYGDPSSGLAGITFSVPARAGDFGAYEIVPATAVGVVDSKGAITEAKILDPGKYFLDNGIPQSVDLIRGGRYYREDSSLTPTASAPVVTVSQIPPSNGSGAKVTVTVDNDVASPTFGEVVSASLDNKGSGYTLLGPPMDCEYRGQCDLYFGSPYVSFRTRGNGKPPEIALYGGTQIVLRAVDPLGDCDSLPSTATLLYGAPAGVEASISNGGTVQASCNPPNWCAPCFCPATLTGTGTHLEITSNYPCNDGFAEYSGAAGDVDFGCSWTDPGSDITYDSDVTVSFHCCPKKCQDDGECMYEMYAMISGILGLPDESAGWLSNGELGRSECVSVTVTDGEVNATFSVQVGEYTFTIVLGGG